MSSLDYLYVLMEEQDTKKQFIIEITDIEYSDLKLLGMIIEHEDGVDDLLDNLESAKLRLIDKPARIIKVLQD